MSWRACALDGALVQPYPRTECLLDGASFGGITGEVAEWSKAPDSKSGVAARLPWVRIPPSPPWNERRNSGVLFLCIASIFDHGYEGTNRRGSVFVGRVVAMMFCYVSAFECHEHSCKSIRGDRHVRRHMNVF